MDDHKIAEQFAALYCLVGALARTHPDPYKLIAAYQPSVDATARTIEQQHGKARADSFRAVCDELGKSIPA
jgi:hypothetical protein